MADDLSQSSFSQISDARVGFEAQVEEVITSALNESKTSLASLVQATTDQLNRLEQHRQTILLRFNEIESITERLDEMDEVTEEVANATEKFSIQKEVFVEKLGNAAEIVESLTALTSESVGGFVEDNFGKVEDFTCEVADLVTEKFDELISSLEDQRDQATEQIKELMTNVLPAGVLKQTDKLTETLEKLNDSGVKEIGRVSESVGEIEDKTKEVEDLIEQVKPILDLARQVL